MNEQMQNDRTNMIQTAKKLRFDFFILDITVTTAKLPTTLPMNYYTTLQKRWQEGQ